jgi:hypothetical protein
MPDQNIVKEITSQIAPVQQGYNEQLVYCVQADLDKRYDLSA